MLFIAHHIKRKVWEKIFMSYFVHGGYPLDVHVTVIALSVANPDSTQSKAFLRRPDVSFGRQPVREWAAVPRVRMLRMNAVGRRVTCPSIA